MIVAANRSKSFKFYAFFITTFAFSFLIPYLIIKNLTVFCDFMAIILLLLVLRLKINNLKLSLIFLISKFIGITAMFSFLSSNGGDALDYYLNGASMAENGSVHWLEVGTQTVTYLSGFIQSLIPVSFFGLAIFGQIIFILCLPNSSEIGENYKRFLLILFLLPSIDFWTSSFNKDTLLICAFMLGLRAFIALNRGQIWRWAMYCFLSGTIAYFIRSYTLPMIFIPQIAILLNKNMKLGFLKSPGVVSRVKTVFLLAIIIILPISFFYTFQYVGVSGGFSGVGDRFNQLGDDMNIGGSAVDLNPLDKFFAIFAPLIYRVKNPLYGVIFLESLYLAYMLWNRIIFKVNLFKNVIFIYTILTIILWTFVYSNLPNLGALVRMKTQILPLIIFLLMEIPYNSNQYKTIEVDR